MKRSARQVNRHLGICLGVCRVVFIVAFALAISVTVAGQARGVGRGGMGGRVGPRGGFAPHRGGFARQSGWSMGNNTPLTGFCDRSPFCVTGAAALGLPFSPFFGGGFFGGGFFDGGWGGFSGFDGGWGSPYSSYEGADNDNFQQQVAQYIGSLGHEVQKLREEAERTRYAAPPTPPAEPKVINVSFSENAPKENVPAAVFVLKDGKRFEATRYVLTADTLWVERTGEPRQTIPAGELNVEATTHANQARGLNFKFPTSRGEIFLGF
jgi:hypothetical protein